MNQIPVLSEKRKKPVGTPQVDKHLRTHVTYPKVYVVAVGDLAEGFRFYGPFMGAETAMQWAVDNFKIGEGLQIYPMSHVRDMRGEVKS